MASSAGRKVVADATVNSTVTAAASAMPVSTLRLTTNIPSSAAMTVTPANTTARPDVVSARTIASGADSPASRPLWYLLTMKRA